MTAPDEESDASGGREGEESDAVEGLTAERSYVEIVTRDRPVHPWFRVYLFAKFPALADDGHPRVRVWRKLALYLLLNCWLDRETGRVVCPKVVLEACEGRPLRRGYELLREFSDHVFRLEFSGWVTGQARTVRIAFAHALADDLAVRRELLKQKIALLRCEDEGGWSISARGSG